MTARDFHIAEIVREAEQTGQLDISYIMAKLNVCQRTAYRILAAYRQHKEGKTKSINNKKGKLCTTRKITHPRRCRLRNRTR